MRRRTRDGKRIIEIAFATPAETNDTFVEKTASCITGSPEGQVFCHVEIRFSDGYVSSITADPGKVHYQQGRMLGNPAYKRFFSLYVSPQDEKSMQSYAHHAAKREIPFNKMGMYWNFLPCLNYVWTVRKNGEAFFCSEYITTLLQLTGRLSELDAAKTSPTALYIAIKGMKDAHWTVNNCQFQQVNDKTPPRENYMQYKKGLKK